MEHIFSKEQQWIAENLCKNRNLKLSTLRSGEIRDLACVWCYYSGKIEGNTYTYVETEALLKDGITSEKKYDDAKMLKNLYNTFIAELEYINKAGNRETIDERTLFRIHRSIVGDLVSVEDAGKLRNQPVRITGTEYIPPKDRESISLKLNEILFRQEQFENPYEKAVYLHCNLARLQPFIDGNKRTSRMMESIVLMNEDIIPIHSSKDADILHYRRALIHFYETEDYSAYADYLLSRQKEFVAQSETDMELG